MAWHSFAILLALFSCISAAPNYQERRLYYNEQDNCCRDNSDQVILEATFNDRPKITQMINGGTDCRTYAISYQDKIGPGEYMTYFKCYNKPEDADFYCDKLVFTQKATYHHVGLWITSIVQKAAIQNPN